MSPLRDEKREREREREREGVRGLYNGTDEMRDGDGEDFAFYCDENVLRKVFEYSGLSEGRQAYVERGVGCVMLRSLDYLSKVSFSYFSCVYGELFVFIESSLFEESISLYLRRSPYVPKPSCI